MSTELLQQASDELRQAGELAPEGARERIHGQSNQLASLAVRERGVADARQVLRRKSIPSVTPDETTTGP